MGEKRKANNAGSHFDPSTKNTMIHKRVAQKTPNWVPQYELDWPNGDAYTMNRRCAPVCVTYFECWWCVLENWVHECVCVCVYDIQIKHSLSMIQLKLKSKSPCGEEKKNINIYLWRNPRKNDIRKLKQHNNCPFSSCTMDNAHISFDVIHSIISLLHEKTSTVT